MPELTLGLLREATGMSPALAERWHPHVVEATERFAITTIPRLSMWLGQCAHESAGYTRTEENLNYSAKGLRATWPKRFPNDEIAKRYARKPREIANYVYGGRFGNVKPNDGWDYRGRGWIQTTFLNNYRDLGFWLGLDLVSHPEIVATDRIAVLSAGAFWQRRLLNTLADAGEFEAVTRRINAALLGIEERREKSERARQALEAA